MSILKLSETLDNNTFSPGALRTVRDMLGDLNFMRSITDHLSAAVAHMGESVLVNLANMTLMRCDVALWA